MSALFDQLAALRDGELLERSTAIGFDLPKFLGLEPSKQAVSAAIRAVSEEAALEFGTTFRMRPDATERLIRIRAQTLAVSRVQLLPPPVPPVERRRFATEARAAVVDDLVTTAASLGYTVARTVIALKILEARAENRLGAESVLRDALQDTPGRPVHRANKAKFSHFISTLGVRR